MVDFFFLLDCWWQTIFFWCFWLCIVDSIFPLELLVPFLCFVLLTSRQWYVMKRFFSGLLWVWFWYLIFSLGLGNSWLYFNQRACQMYRFYLSSSFHTMNFYIWSLKYTSDFLDFCVTSTFFYMYNTVLHLGFMSDIYSSVWSCFW